MGDIILMIYVNVPNMFQLLLNCIYSNQEFDSTHWIESANKGEQ